MTAEDGHRTRAVRDLVARVDDVLESALRDHLPLEAYVGEVLEAFAEALQAEAVVLRTFDENLAMTTFVWPPGAEFASQAAALAAVTDGRERYRRSDAGGTVIGRHLDAAGELFGLVGARWQGPLAEERRAAADEIVDAFAETIDNQLAFIAVFRQKSLVSRELSEALMDPVLERGIDSALAIFRRAVPFDDLLLVVRDDHASQGGRLTYRIIQGGVVTHEAGLTGDVSVEEFVRKHATAMIHGDSRSLLAQLGITRFREEALIQGVRDKRVLGKIVVTSRRGELSTFDRDILERFCDVLQQRLVDHAREWRHLSLFFPRATVERLLAQEGYDEQYLRPREGTVAILYADISGFTRLSEQVLKEPATIARLVDTWSQRAVDVVFELGGVFDKMVGDCVIALFGPPFYEWAAGESCRRALDAAHRIRQLTRDLGAGKEIPELAGLDPPLGVAIGLHFGRVFVGRIGPDENFTAFGSVMNNTARLQGLATRDQILCMDAFVDAIAAPDRFGDERSAPVKNVAEPLRFREVVR